MIRLKVEIIHFPVDLICPRKTVWRARVIIIVGEVQAPFTIFDLFKIIEVFQ